MLWVVVRSGPELRAFSVRFLCLVSGVRKCALQCSLAEPRFTVSPTKETENYMAQSSSLGSDQLKSHMGHLSNGGQQWKDKSSLVFSSMGTGANLIASLPFLPNSPWIFLTTWVVWVCLPVSSLFSVKTAACIVVFPMCLWWICELCIFLTAALISFQILFKIV